MVAQQPGEPLSLDSAVNLALRNYPTLRAARAQVIVASGGIDLARSAYLPKTDLLWQENRASRNNIFGLLLPQSVIPGISGPVLGTKALSSTWGSAGGTLVSWEPFDFGLRSANLNAARAARDQAEAGVESSSLAVATAAADAFLAAVAADETVRAAEANVQRMKTFADTVRVLVQNELRPGVEASRADAESAIARNQLIQAQQISEIARATLAENLGLSGTSPNIDRGPLLEAPPPDLLPQGEPTKPHPLEVVQRRAIETVQARERALSHSYFPRINFQSAFFGRGTGAQPDGKLNGSLGLLPDTPNFATGLTVSFDPMTLFSIRARLKIESGNEALEQARHEQVLQFLKAENARAQAALNAARRIAENTPIQLAAARETEQRARVRYDAGLTNVIEVAEAQRLLAQAEIDHAVARLSIWRTLLAMARARGDLGSFLQQFSAAQLQRRN